MCQDIKSDGCGGCGGCHSNKTNNGQEASCSCPIKKGSAIAITFENNERYDCRLLAKIEVNEQDYVVLEHPINRNQLLYRYDEEGGSIYLGVISGDEFEMIAKIYKSMRS